MRVCGSSAVVLTALGAVIAARRAEMDAHVVEVGPGEYDVVLRVEGPFTRYDDARRAAGFLRDTLRHVLPGPELASRNPRGWLIRPAPIRPRAAK